MSISSVTNRCVPLSQRLQLHARLIYTIPKPVASQPQLCTTLAATRTMAAAAPQQQTAVHVTSFDHGAVSAGWANIEVAQVAKPVPGVEQALVRITARALNPSDLIRAAGRYGPTPLPFVNGGEGVGVVEASSSGTFTPGQRVVSPAWGAGTWQQFIAVPEDQLVAVPEAVDDKSAAQAWTNPVTVLGLLDVVGDVPQGEYLLHSAAGSVLGRMLVQLAARRGIRVISIVRRQEQVQELKDLGAADVIDSSSEDVVARVKQITGGRGAWTSLDAVNGEFAGVVLRATRNGGTLRIMGVLNGDTTTIDTIDMRAGDKALRGFVLPKWIAAQGAGAGVKRLKEALRLIADGVIAPLPGESYPLEQVHEAIAASQRPGRGGKVFLTSP